MSGPVTLPGEIPGLLIPGVLVIYRGERWRLVETYPDGSAFIATTGCIKTDCFVRDLALDLSDRVSRVAAAWWLTGPVTDEEHTVLITVKVGGHVNRRGQEQLRDMVLRRYNRSQT